MALSGHALRGRAAKSCLTLIRPSGEGEKLKGKASWLFSSAMLILASSELVPGSAFRFIPSSLEDACRSLNLSQLIQHVHCVTSSQKICWNLISTIRTILVWGIESSRCLKTSRIDQGEILLAPNANPLRGGLRHHRQIGL